MSGSAVLRTLIGPQGPAGTSGVAIAEEVSGTTGPLASAATINIDVAMSKVATIMVIETTAPAWIRVYQTAAARTADAARLVTQDPISGTGVVGEVLTSAGGLVQALSPTFPFFNNDTIPADVAYLAITNYDPSTQDIGVTIKFLPMSA